ncbi:MAG: GNAT family N-acetyltransferase [Ruminococcus sp.]|nr:GNAT family N-acetyltransferase [Ruminococcus sp.]
MPDSRFVFSDSLSVEDFLRLRAEVDWIALPVEQAQAGLDNTFACISVSVDGETVGMARMLWDGCYCAFLTDVVVSGKYRHNGLATEMVQRLIDRLRAEKKDGWYIKLYLMAAHGRESFYEKFGLYARPSGEEGAGMNMWL